MTELVFDPFVFCTNSIAGHDLTAGLDAAQYFGFKKAELSAIDGGSEQLFADRLSPAYVREIELELEKRDLECFAVSGHCDMTDPVSFEKLLKKIRLAGELGALYFNTRCGPKSRYDVFLKNVEAAAGLAASYGMTLDLESYGDIVGPAEESGGVFAALEEAGIENVRYNYDPGNTFRFRRGDISIENDLRNANAKVSYLHLKDTEIREGIIWHEAIGQGCLNYPEIFAALAQTVGRLPCGLELPFGFSVNMSDLSFNYLSPEKEMLYKAIETSIKYTSEYAKIVY